MDAFVQLALMTKAKLVFEAEDTFLSFPALSPFGYAPDDLKLTHDAVTSARDTVRLSEFARIANQIPRGVIAPVEEGEFLWDVCTEVLAMGEAAAGDLTPAERARLDAARSVLYVQTGDGLRQDSPALAAYKRCRDAYIAALEEYRNRQLTAEAATDPAERGRWTQEEEPRLKQALAAADAAWQIQGQKAQVDEAMQVEQLCAARQPSQVWEAWKGEFIHDIVKERDTENILFAPTLFTPGDIVDASWPRFTLTAAEMASLAAQAPPELLDIFGRAAAPADIESVTFEYRSVAITRSWLPKRLFQSRFWRLRADGEFSDGGHPAQGRCPAYITALVFFRHVEVRRRQPAGALPAPSGRPVGLLRLDPAQLRPDSLQLKTVPVTAPTPRPVVDQARRTIFLAPARAMPTAALTSPYARVAPEALAVQPQVRLTPQARLLNPNIIREIQSPPILVPRPYPLPPVDSRPAPTPRPAPPTAPPPGPEAHPDEIGILAFICRRLPRCPDPDPSLTWG